MADTSTAAGAGVVFKGRMMTLTVLEIRDTDIERIAEQIARQLERTPDFFARMPVLLSLPGERPELARVRDAARDAGLLVVGVLDPVTLPRRPRRARVSGY